MIGLATLTEIGIFLGTLLAEKINTSDKVVFMALHWTAGMMLGVVGVEIMSKILKSQPAWPMIFTVFAGGFLAIAVDKLRDNFAVEVGKCFGGFTYLPRRGKYFLLSNQGWE